MQAIHQIIDWEAWPILGASAIILFAGYAMIGAFAYYMGKRTGC